MPSKLLRRSGVALVNIADLLDWQPDVIYQVGVGMHSEETDVMKEAWPNAKFIGFEPHPASFRGRKENYPGILFPVALGAEEGNRELHFRKRHKDGATFFPFEGQSEGRCEVVVSVLDDFVGNMRSFKPNDMVLLWLDCEGSELDVLLGAKKFLPWVDVVNVEMTAKPRSEEWCSQIEVHDKLVREGFFRQWIHTQRSCIGQYDAIYVRPEHFRSEYCCDPEEVKRAKRRN